MSGSKHKTHGNPPISLAGNSFFMHLGYYCIHACIKKINLIWATPYSQKALGKKKITNFLCLKGKKKKIFAKSEIITFFTFFCYQKLYDFMKHNVGGEKQ